MYVRPCQSCQLLQTALHCTPKRNDVVGHFLICDNIHVDLPLVDCHCYVLYEVKICKCLGQLRPPTVEDRKHEQLSVDHTLVVFLQRRLVGLPSVGCIVVFNHRPIDFLKIPPKLASSAAWLRKKTSRKMCQCLWIDVMVAQLHG